MSWSMKNGPVTVNNNPNLPYSEFEGPLRDAELAGNEDASEERQESYRCAADAVISYLDDAPMGVGKFKVSINGYSNPNNTPANISPDFMNITITKEKDAE